MSKNTNGCAAVKGAKKNTNTAARKAAKKTATKWTAKQEAKAKRYYSAYTPKEKKCADRLAKKYGCEPWEIVADAISIDNGGKLKIMCDNPSTKKPAKRITSTFMSDADTRFEAYIPLSAHNVLLAYMEKHGLESKPDAMQNILCERTDEEVANVTPAPLKRGELQMLVSTDIPAKYASRIEQVAKKRGCKTQDIVAGLILLDDPAHLVTVPEQDKMRVERWRGHVAEIVTNHDARGVDIPSAWFEEIEGRPMVDVITDYICRTRGVGVANPPLGVKLNHEGDCEYETYNTRTRNVHEREVASCAVMYHLDYHQYRFTEDETHELIRRFYRKGDCGIDNAVFRAVESALAWERDADANAAK